MTSVTSNTQQISHGQSILDEVLGQIVVDITSHGDVDDHPMLQIANTHGSGFITGSAAALLDSVAVEYGQDRETDLIAAAVFSILAVVADRMRDAAFLANEETKPDPSPWATAGFDKDDAGGYFEDLLKKISTAPTKFARAA